MNTYVIEFGTGRRTVVHKGTNEHGEMQVVEVLNAGIRRPPLHLLIDEHGNVYRADRDFLLTTCFPEGRVIR